MPSALGLRPTFSCSHTRVRLQSNVTSGAYPRESPSGMLLTPNGLVSVIGLSEFVPKSRGLRSVRSDRMHLKILNNGSK